MSNFGSELKADPEQDEDTPDRWQLWKNYMSDDKFSLARFLLIYMQI